MQNSRHSFLRHPAQQQRGIDYNHSMDLDGHSARGLGYGVDGGFAVAGASGLLPDWTKSSFLGHHDMSKLGT